MYNKLIDALKTEPAAYETTGIAFWDDEHVSKSMLQAHLSPLADGASRKHAFMEASVNWIATLPLPGQALLDLGCGPGLYAQLFAEKGFCVTGIDFSKRSIEYAKQAALGEGKNIRYLYQNYMEIDYTNAFDAVTLIYCDFGVLPPQSRKQLLGKIYAALKPNGLFIVDAWTPAQYLDFEDNMQTTYEDTGFWREEPYICIQKNKRYENQVFLEQYTIVTKENCETYNNWNHAFTPDELEADLQQAGFTMEGLYGNVAGPPFNDKSTSLCAVGKKAE